MAFSIGNGRYYKLFSGNVPPRRVLFKDLSEPGLLSRAFIQGTVVKVYPIKCSERFGKLCKILLKEDVEKSTKNSQLAVINTFLLGDLADEGSRICEGDCVVLAEVIVECSPTGEHQFQLIVWREKSQASIWVINNKGRVRANTTGGKATSSSDEVEEAEMTKTADTYDLSADSDKDLNMLFESCEHDFSKSTSKDGKNTSEQTKQKVFGKRKGKFHLGPKGVTPSISHVKRNFSNLTVLLDKGETKMAMKTRQEDKYYSKSQSENVDSKGKSRKKSCDSGNNISTEPCTCTTPVPIATSVPIAGTPNTGVPNAGALRSGTPNAGAQNSGTPNAGTPNSWRPNACTTSAGERNVNGSRASPVSHHVPSVEVETGGQSMIVSQKTGPGRGAGSVSPSIQSTNSDKPSKMQGTHIELTPSRVSTRGWNGDPVAGQIRDQSQMSALSNDLPQLMATKAGCSSSKICEEDDSLKIGDFQDKPSEDSVMPDFEQEEHVFMSARRMSASSEIHHGSPTKGKTERSPGTPHRLKIIVQDLQTSSSVRTMIPDDYTPASSLLAKQDSSDRGVKRSPIRLSLDPKRLKTSPVPSHQAPSPDRAGNTFSDQSRRSSPRRAAVDYTSRAAVDSTSRATVDCTSRAAADYTSRAAVDYTSRAASDYTVPPGYTTLANLQADTRVNVYGVVKLFKPAWKCRGTDMCSVLVLMDPTIAESSTGLECISFQPSVSRLPAVHRIGDIVRLHRIKISQYQGRLQAKSTRGFAAIVFDRETELPVTAEMARVSSSTFTLTQSDKETVASLKNWCDVHPVLFPPGNPITLSRINPDSYFDLTCQVLGIASHRTLDCVVLYVTDGTRPVHDLRKCTGDEYNVAEPLYNRSSRHDDVTSVFLYGSHAEVARLLVKKDGYVILHNVHSQVLKPGGNVCSVLDVVKPYMELCVHRGTAFGRGVSVLSADSPEVNLLKRQQNL